MLVSVSYTTDGRITGVYKEQAPHRARAPLRETGVGRSVGIVLKADGSLGSLQAWEIKKQFRVADVPKEGFVVLERIKDA